MNDHFLCTLFHDAGSSVLAAALITFSVLELKAWRVSARLRDIASVLDEIENRSFHSIRNIKISESRARAESELKEIKEELERNSEGTIQLSRTMRHELRSIEESLAQMSNELFGAYLMEALNYDAQKGKIQAKVADLKRGIRSLARRIHFWSFLRP